MDDSEASLNVDSDAGQHLVLDTRGQRCPYPVIALGHAWTRLQQRPGQNSITITADDPVATIDIPAWCDIKQVRYQRLDDRSTSEIVFRIQCDVTEDDSC